MRVIGGRFKGKKLLEPKDKETRPLKDLTKESIFNIINHSNKFSINIKKANVLDLFAGVGSFGIECLSHGASYVTFVEKYEGVLPILKKNLNNLKSEINYEVVDHNNYIGGRYSVLSEVGMLPAELMGLNYKKFRQLNNLVNNKFFIKSLVSNVESTIHFLKTNLLLEFLHLKLNLSFFLQPIFFMN